MNKDKFVLCWTLVLLLSVFTENSRACLSLPTITRRQEIVDEDDAVIIDSDLPDLGAGPEIPAGDGPGPSLLGSVDNIFKSIKDFDQYRCIERMICEYMQEEGDVASALVSPTNLISQFTGGPSATASGVPGAGSFGSSTPTRLHAPGSHFGGPHQTFQQTFTSHGGNHHQYPYPHNYPYPQHHYPQTQHQQSPSFLTSLTDLILGKRRRQNRRYQTNFARSFRKKRQSDSIQVRNIFWFEMSFRGLTPIFFRAT